VASDLELSHIWKELDEMNGHLGMIAEYLRVIAEKDGG
jgi:hypothetical protein